VGLPLPKHLEGTSFKPLLTAPERAWKTAAFSQYPRKVGAQNLMGYSMRTDRYRLTRWVQTKDHSKVLAVELYDHQTDPQENINIAEEPGNKALLATLTAQWEKGWKGSLPKKPVDEFWTMEFDQPVPLPPTLANVPYGKDKRQVLDFWKADSKKPTPVLFFIHGGAWKSNDKDRVTSVRRYLNAGISVVSINYRFVPEAQAAGIKPPVQWPLQDAARALQFVRSKAAEWNLDKTRVGASGGSAGACTSLWLALHNDLADPKSDDPIAHESTRPNFVGVLGAQTSLDPVQMKEWTPNSLYGGHAFGFNGDRAKKLSSFQQFLDHRDEILPWIKEYSPFELINATAPPIFLHYTEVPNLGKTQKDPTHTANFGVKFQEKLLALGIECHFMYPGTPNVTYENPVEFLITKLIGL
jgi:acetyl esterase/lipase